MQQRRLRRTNTRSLLDGDSTFTLGARALERTSKRGRGPCRKWRDWNTCTLVVRGLGRGREMAWAKEVALWKPTLCKLIKKIHNGRGCGDGSVKGTCCSWRGPCYSSQDPTWNLTTAYNSSSSWFDSLSWLLWALHACGLSTDMQAKYTYKTKINHFKKLYTCLCVCIIYVCFSCIFS